MLNLARIRIRSSENGIEDGGQIHGVDGRGEGRGDDRAGAWKTGFLCFERDLLSFPKPNTVSNHTSKGLGRYQCRLTLFAPRLSVDQSTKYWGPPKYTTTKPSSQATQSEAIAAPQSS